MYRLKQYKSFETIRIVDCFQVKNIREDSQILTVCGILQHSHLLLLEKASSAPTISGIDGS